MALNDRFQNVKAILSLFHSLHRNLLLLNQLNLLGQEVKLGLKVSNVIKLGIRRR